MTSEFAIAVHALVFLNHKGCCLSSEKIAENVCTNPVTVRKVLAKLKRAGLVETKEGIEGGSCFVKNPARVTLAQICAAMDEIPVTVSKRTGYQDRNCLLALGMADMMEDIYANMNAQCLEYLKETTIADIERKIFGNAGGKEEKNKN